MNRQEIENFVFSARQDDTPHVFRQGLDLLEKHNIPGHIEVLAMTLTTHAMLSPDELVGLLVSDVMFCMETLLKVQGIGPASGLRLDQLIDVVEGIDQIDDYEDAQSLRDILQTEWPSAEDAFLECLSLASGREVAYFSPLILSVHNNVPKMLLDNLLDRAKAMEEVYVTEPEKIEVWRTFMAQVEGADTSFACELTDSPDMVGLPFEAYWTIWNGTRGKNYDLESAGDVGRICLDLIGLACLSEDFQGKPLEAVQGKVSAITPDVQLGVKLVTRAQEICRQMIKKA